MRRMAHRRVLAAGVVIPQDPQSVNVLGLALGVVSAVLLAISALVCFIWMRWRRDRKFTDIPITFSVDSESRRQSEGTAEEEQGEEAEDSPVEPTAFTYQELLDATEDFKEELLIKETGYSSVHKGVGPKGELWAVKRAKGMTVQGENLFSSEVDFLGKVSHQCLQPLRGFCSEQRQQVLVFDYLPNGTLTSWLRPSTPAEARRAPLTLSQRLSIAAGVADALRYLHAFRRPTIIHRDVRSDKIFLAEDMSPQLAGLGLLKHLPGDNLRLRIANRKGYLDPEYLVSFKVTAKCDVYSFGVVLLELLTGCAPFVQASRDPLQQPMHISAWASQALEAGRFLDVLDPRIPDVKDESVSDVLRAMLTLACACVAEARKDRPDMAKVSALLFELQKAPRDASVGVVALSRQQAVRGRVVPMG